MIVNALNKVFKIIRFNLIKLFNNKSIEAGRNILIGKKARIIVSNDGHISFENGFQCEDFTVISANEGNIKFGKNVYFNRSCGIYSHGNIDIGDRCMFGPNVLIYDHDHLFDRNGIKNTYKIGNVKIGNDCWIGAGVIILRNSVIGEGSVIGAGSIIKGVIPAHTIVKSDNRLILTEILE